MKENVGSIVGLTMAMSSPYMELIGSQYGREAPPSGSTPSLRWAPRIASISTTFLRSRTYGKTKSSWCVDAARIALLNGTRLTPAFPARNNSFARSWTQWVTSVSAGPPLGGLYLKPPSSGGLWEGVMTMPSAQGTCRVRLHTRMACEITGVGVTPSSFWMMVSTLFAARTSSAEHWAGEDKACVSFPMYRGPLIPCALR